MKKRLFLGLLLAVLCVAALVACGEKKTYGISADIVQNGTIVPSKAEAEEGETITVTFAPEEGYIFKEGSLSVNGTKVSGNSFVMPKENVYLSGEFVLENYQGVYVYSEYVESRNAYIFEFIEVGENTLNAGVTLATYDDNFNYIIYENVPYTETNYVLSATVGGEEWTAYVGNGTLFQGANDYMRVDFVPLSGTYTEICEQNTSFVKRDYTFNNDGTVDVETFDGNNTTETTCEYRQYGSFLYLEMPDEGTFKNQIMYGILSETDGSFTFKHNQFYIYTYPEDTKHVITDVMLFYPAQADIALKENGAYILQESVNPFNGEDWDAPECYDFLSLANGALAFSRHNGNMHFFTEQAESVRYGNVLKVSYQFDEKPVSWTFHILDENTVVIRDTMNSLRKYVFTKNSTFEKGYGAAYGSSDSATYEVSYYEDGRFGVRHLDKQTNFAVSDSEYGTYQVYGDILVAKLSGGEVHIGKIEPQTAHPDNADFLFNYKLVSGIGLCEEGTSEPLWKEIKGWQE